MSVDAPAGGTGLLVAISGSPGSMQLIRDASQLAKFYGVAWEAIHIETPQSGYTPEGETVAADALGLAARLGATIAAIPATSVADGILAHLESSPAGHLVLGTSPAPRWRWPWRPSLVETLVARDPDLLIHLRPRLPTPNRPQRREGPKTSGAFASYVLATSLVLATLLVAEVLQLFLGTRPLDLLFLFPVIAVAARQGMKPALLATGLSVVSYNFFLLQPELSFAPAAPQNLVMTTVLVGVAAYTSLATQRMRGRLRLSDRSARENASVAALAQKLTRDSDWEATAQTICEHVHGLLHVNVRVYREIDGVQAIAGALPPAQLLGPVDQAALDWAWTHGTEAGAGSTVLSAADWQFQPLKTSLGVLAVLGIARDDGRDPVRPDQRVLLLTLVAQAALAHERLRLEDRARAAVNADT